MRPQELYHLGEAIGSLSQRVTALEELRDKVRKVEEHSNLTRRLLILLALLTSSVLGHLKAEQMAELLVLVIKSALTKS